MRKHISKYWDRSWLLSFLSIQLHYSVCSQFEWNFGKKMLGIASNFAKQLYIQIIFLEAFSQRVNFTGKVQIYWNNEKLFHQITLKKLLPRLVHAWITFISEWNAWEGPFFPRTIWTVKCASRKRLIVIDTHLEDKVEIDFIHEEFFYPST